MRALLAVLLFVPLTASAFCGFYVSGAGGKLFNDASMVVLVRDGTRTVLSMQNNYRGPPENFALVVPVPVVLQKGNVTTLPREAFTRLDELTSPRLVQMEVNPCGIGTGRGLMGGGGGYGAGVGDSLKQDLGVKVEAKFDVEEYEIVILSAESSLGLNIWLKEMKYNIPDGAEGALKPYVAAGSKFFVAKVDAKKVKMKDGQAVLSPLRFHYDSEAFTLPVRMGLLNSSGSQDLIVHIIAMSRYELANMKNVLVPTNFDVRTRVSAQFGGFYSELVNRTFKKSPGAAVTEFAWEGALPPPTEYVGGGIYGVTCDPCPPPHPVDNPLARYLGVNLMPKIKTDEGIAAFARNATITRLHLRYTKDSAPDDLVFKAVAPVAGGVPEVKTPAPAKHNRFQGRYVMWVQGCGDGMGTLDSTGSAIGVNNIGGGNILGGGIGNGGLAGIGTIGVGSGRGTFYSAGSPLSRPQAESNKLIDPFEQLLVADLPELDVKAVPLAKDAPKLPYVEPQPLTPMPQMQQVAQGPTVTIGTPQAVGALDPVIITRILRQNMGAFNYCHQKELQVNPTVAGRMMIRFIISPNGSVTQSITTQSTGDGNLDACVTGRVRTLMFPAPKGGGIVDVRVPFIFRSQ
jgi:TonB family protein